MCISKAILWFGLIYKVPSIEMLLNLSMEKKIRRQLRRLGGINPKVIHLISSYLYSVKYMSSGRLSSD